MKTRLSGVTKIMTIWNMKKYDFIVIGGGSAGFSVLEQISHQGLKIALVENRKLGGSCPNFACVPTKALVKSAEILHTARTAEAFGITIKNVGFDWKKVQEYRADKVANTAASESEQDLKEKEVDLLWGTAKFISPNTIEVGGEKYRADKFAITTGSRAAIPNIPGIDEVGVIDSDKAVELKKLPKSLAIIGAGPVGIELAQLFARFGVLVTVIVRGNQILSREEPEVAEMAKKHLEADAIRFLFDTHVTGLTSKGKEKQVHVNILNKHDIVAVEEIVMAIGRTPNIDRLNIKAAKIGATAKGIKTNEHMQTSQPHIYSAGDVAGNLLFTHNASYEGYVIGRNLLGERLKVDHRVIPRGTFSDPEIGSVGIMETEAKEEGYNVLTATMPYGGGRGDIVSDPEGLIKVTVDAKTRQIVGASVIGRMAAEFVHFLALAMHAKIPVDTLDTMVYAFPTYAEGIAGVTEYLE